MNDDIKKIIDKLEKLDDLTTFDYVTLYIYITNLQQENERLKELVNPKTQIFIDTQDMEERYGEELCKEYLEKQVKDYKSRCEKAVELTQNLLNTENSGYYKIIFQKQLDTLNGRSE